VLILAGRDKEILKVGAVMERVFTRNDHIELAPDEALLLTAAHRYALPGRGLLLAERMSTLVYYAGDDDTRHPVTWRSLRAKATVCAHFEGSDVNKQLCLVEVLADAALPDNSSLFLRKVHLARSADMDQLLRLLQNGPWKS
jgi:hypothetical protein